MNKGHGRIEIRELDTTPALSKYLSDWPGPGQVFRIRRQRITNGKATDETVYGITSLKFEVADAERLLALNRGHWEIENLCHGIRDTHMGEDACRVRSSDAPQVLAGLRNAATHLLHGTEAKNKKKLMRRYTIHPMEALVLLDD